MEETSAFSIVYRGLASSQSGAPALTYGGSCLGISNAFQSCIAKHYPEYTDQQY